jgi:hypothetical protein
MAEVKGSVAYVDVKRGRPVNITTLGGGWPKLFQGLTRNAERAAALK